jgi:hypothetical protein
VPPLAPLDPLLPLLLPLLPPLPEPPLPLPPELPPLLLPPLPEAPLLPLLPPLLEAPLPLPPELLAVSAPASPPLAVDAASPHAKNAQVANMTTVIVGDGLERMFAALSKQRTALASQESPVCQAPCVPRCAAPAGAARDHGRAGELLGR